MKIKLFSDVYNISNRIKNIDKDYYIVLNTSTNKFEVHNRSQVDSTYCLTLPFKNLDERTLNYVNETKSVNIKNILQKMEIDNKIKESAAKHSTLSNIYQSIEDLRR